MSVLIKHHHQTAKSNNPNRDVSATAWNEEHDVLGLGGLAQIDDAPSDGNPYLRKNAAWVQGPINSAWPIGSVFISVVSTDPSTLLGFGTWAAFGAGKVLIGLDAGDANFDTAEETGGAKTSTPDAHAGTAIADHAAKNTDQAGTGETTRGTTASTVTLKTHVHQVTAYAHSVTQPDGHAAMSIVQPYIVCYFWKRTA
jgi:hypothetical protein